MQKLNNAIATEVMRQEEQAQKTYLEKKREEEQRKQSAAMGEIADIAIKSVQSADYDPESIAKIVSPVSWRILVDPIEVPTESEGGLAYPPETIRALQYLRYYGKVIAIGPLAFQDQRFFGPITDSNPSGHYPSCKVGDWIVYGTHTGFEVHIKAGGNKIRRLRTVNDDQVVSVISDISQLAIEMPGGF